MILKSDEIKEYDYFSMLAMHISSLKLLFTINLVLDRIMETFEVQIN